jgi:hypothetical protein
MSDQENDNIVESNVKVTTISHHTMLDLLRATLLVYNYGKNFKVNNTDETVEEFVSELKEEHELEKIEMNSVKKNVLVEISENVPTGKLHKFINDPDTDIQVGIAISEGKKRITVVFRGSESISDWYYDLMVFKQNLKDDIYVHSGFYTQLTTNSVYDELVENIKTVLHEHPDFDIYVTGHSLGGALSTLFGYMLANTVESKVNVVSFASPRVGNYEWKKSFEETKNLTHYRITNKRDIVTAFPMYRYYHVGINIQLSDEKYKIYKDSSEKKWYAETFFTCWSASEHNCELYYTRMNENTW